LLIGKEILTYLIEVGYIAEEFGFAFAGN